MSTAKGQHRSVWMTVEWDEGNDVMMEQIEELVLQGADPEEQFVHDDGVVMTPLAGAVWTQNADAVFFLTENCKVDVDRIPQCSNTPNTDGITPLMTAAYNGDFDIVNTLVLVGQADTERRDERGLTAMHHAALNGNTATIRVLVALKAETNARCQLGRTPLMTAADAQNLDVLSTLLRLGADPNLEDECGESAFTLALCECSTMPDILNTFLRAGADPVKGLAWAKSKCNVGIQQSLEKVVKDRCESQIRSFLLGRHGRLGAESKVSLLVNDTVSEVMRHLFAVNHLSPPPGRGEPKSATEIDCSRRQGSAKRKHSRR